MKKVSDPYRILICPWDEFAVPFLLVSFLAPWASLMCTESTDLVEKSAAQYTHLKPSPVGVLWEAMCRFRLQNWKKPGMMIDIYY